jgi:NADPH2:quinone reductase
MDSDQMNAWVARGLGEPRDVMEIAQMKIPSPSAGQIRIKVEATGLNFPDLLQLRGGYQVKPTFPLVVGSEVAGTIDAVGADLSPDMVGQRVAATVSGGLAAYALATPGVIHGLTGDISFEKAAALLSNYTTTYYALHDRGALARDETLLVTAAAGGVGSAAVQLGLAAGARVIAAVGSAEKAEFCRNLGVDEVINYSEEDLVERVRDLTDDNGADVVYDPVGGDIFDAARRVVAFDGRYLIIGFTSGRIPSAPANHVLLKNYSLVGVHWGAAIARTPQRMPEIYQELLKLFDDGKLDPPLFRNSGAQFSEAAELLASLGDRSTTGKVVITAN